MARIKTKRYEISKLHDGRYIGVNKQFPAADKADSLIQGARHAERLGWSDYRVSYIGSWSIECDPGKYNIAPPPCR